MVEAEENPPDRDDYFRIRADVSSSGFAGSSTFWVGRTALTEFVDQLEEFDRKLSGTAELMCGWNDEIEFGLAFHAYDRLGHIGVRVEVASQMDSRASTRHRLVVEFEIDPNQLRSLTEALNRMRTNATGDAVLRGISKCG